MEKKLRIGVIGTGTFSLYHLDAITNNKRAELVAVADKDPESRAVWR